MNKIFGALSIAVIIAATAITLSSTWPSGAINLWQVKLTGDNKYFPALTIFIIALPPLLVLVIIKKLLQTFGKK